MEFLFRDHNALLAWFGMQCTIDRLSLSLSLSSSHSLPLSLSSSLPLSHFFSLANSHALHPRESRRIWVHRVRSSMSVRRCRNKKVPLLLLRSIVGTWSSTYHLSSSSYYYYQVPFRISFVFICLRKSVNPHPT
jgi:hypothetical protein